MSKMTTAELQAFLEKDFPQSSIIVEEIKSMWAKVRYPISNQHLRPGGTVSGPAQMAAVDGAMYMAILGELGPIALAVTTNLNINFLRKPVLQDLIGEARILKLGKRLVVGDVLLFSEGKPEPIAHATCTYSIPPR